MLSVLQGNLNNKHKRWPEKTQHKVLSCADYIPLVAGKPWDTIHLEFKGTYDFISFYFLKMRDYYHHIWTSNLEKNVEIIPQIIVGFSFIFILKVHVLFYLVFSTKHMLVVTTLGCIMKMLDKMHNLAPFSQWESYWVSSLEIIMTRPDPLCYRLGGRMVFIILFNGTLQELYYNYSVKTYALTWVSWTCF